MKKRTKIILIIVSVVVTAAIGTGIWWWMKREKKKATLEVDIPAIKEEGPTPIPIVRSKVAENMAVKDLEAALGKDQKLRNTL